MGFQLNMYGEPLPFGLEDVNVEAEIAGWTMVRRI